MKKPKNEIKDLRQFGIVLAIIAAVFGTVHFIKGRISWYPWFFGVSFISACLALAAPKALRPVFIVFTKIAHAIGWFNTRAILIAVYFIVITPIALLMKLFRKDTLHRAMYAARKSYWIQRTSVRATKEGLEKQF